MTSRTVGFVCAIAIIIVALQQIVLLRVDGAALTLQSPERGPPILGHRRTIEQRRGCQGEKSAFLYNRIRARTPITGRRRKTSTLTPLRAWPLERDPKGVAPDYPLRPTRIAVTVASTFLTWYAQQAGRQTTSVLASSAVTLACSACLDRRLGQAAFCGTFAGMSSDAVVPTPSHAVVLGGLTSILYEVIIHRWNAFLGIGGRLGATAFVATSLVAAWQKVRTGVAVKSVYGVTSSQFRQLLLADMVLWHAVGAVATIALREASDDSAAADPVRASAVVGLLASLLLEDPGTALAVYGGSFVGMSLPSRLLYGVVPGSTKKSVNVKDKTTTAKLFAAFAAAGAMAGFVHALTISLGWWPGGWGGKAGLCSFFGCLIFRGLAKLRLNIRARSW